MKFRYFLFLICFCLASQAQAYFFVKDICDSDGDFEISSEEACKTICPNRHSVFSGGSSVDSYICTVSKDNEDGRQEETKSDDEDGQEEVKIDCEDIYMAEDEYKSEEEYTSKMAECEREAIKNEVHNICLGKFSAPNAKLLEDICIKNGEYKTEVDIAGTKYCIRKCPKETPLMGIAGDCYSCDVDYAISLDEWSDLTETDNAFENVCPNRIINGKTSYKNFIDEVNTIQKVENLIKQGHKIDKEYHGFTLLQWNVMLNNDPNVVEYLIKNGAEFSVYTISAAIDKKAPEAVLEVLLKNAKDDNLRIFIPHGNLYGHFLKNDWNVPLSLYAEYAGADENIINLLKKYEDIHGIKYEPEFEKIDSDKY